MTELEFCLTLEHVLKGTGQYYNLTILPIFFAGIFIFYGVNPTQ